MGDGAIPEPTPGLKRKNLIPVPNPFIKFKPRPIKGGVGRVSEKTHPVAIPIYYVFQELPMI